MRTVVEPQQHIAALWSKPEVRNGETFRLMRYVFRVDHESKVLLHNIVTGQLVVLDQEEAKILDVLPAQYTSQMKQLVDDHFLVSYQFDEYQQVSGLRTVLRKLDALQRNSGITTYTILPTTACNARCYYCFEHGTKIVTMSEQTANDTVDYIVSHCGTERKVFITWFGGEPTVAANRISQISEGLRKNNIHYQSEMTSNGYLFDQEMVSQAKTLWNLRRIQICVDGTEKNYNETKLYVNASENPYQRVMRNIQLLLDAKIAVGLRMNFDIGNYTDFEDLVKEVKERFQGNRLLHLSVHPIIGEHAGKNGIVLHGNDAWFEDKIVELNQIGEEADLIQRKAELPHLQHKLCLAASDYAITITADGSLARCPEQFDDDQITGNLKEGQSNIALVQSWKKLADWKRCRNCIFSPTCVLVKNCSTSEKCYSVKQKRQELTKAIMHQIQKSLTKPN